MTKEQLTKGNELLKHINEYKEDIKNINILINGGIDLKETFIKNNSLGSMLIYIPKSIAKEILEIALFDAQKKLAQLEKQFNDL